MKKVVKNSVFLILILSIIISAFVFSVNAAGTIIAVSGKSVTVGNNLSVTITLDAGEAMYGVACNFQYNPDVLKYVSGNASGDAGFLRIIESPSGNTKVSYTLNFTALKAGSSNLSVTDASCEVLGSAGATSKALTGASTSISVNDITLSGNADLKTLTLSSGTLSPKFSATRTSYNVNVPNSVVECKVYATTADPNAKISVQGSASLKIGKNTRSVIVTAPNGAQKTYTINITRSEAEQVPETDNPLTEPENPTTETPLDVDINGTIHTIQTDISSSKVFSGFSPITEQFNGQDVTVLKDNNDFKIYYLKAQGSEEFIPFVYNEKDKAFEKLVYFTQNNIDYIISKIPEDSTVSDSYYETNTTINGNNIKCFASNNSSLSDFVYIYAYKDGKYGFYRYDKLENVLQRYPELELKEIEKESNIEIKPKDNFFSRISLLTTNAKIILFGLLILIIVAISLAVLLIIKLIKNKNEDLDLEFEEDVSFESVSIVSDSFDTEEDTETSTESDDLTTDETTTE